MIPAQAQARCRSWLEIDTHSWAALDLRGARLMVGQRELGYQLVSGEHVLVQVAHHRNRLKQEMLGVRSSPRVVRKLLAVIAENGVLVLERVCGNLE